VKNNKLTNLTKKIKKSIYSMMTTKHVTI